MSFFFIPLGGGNEVGGSSYYLRIGEDQILIDAGARIHGSNVFPNYDAIRYEDPAFRLSDLSAIFLTHAHIDHIGSLPKVYYEAPDVPIYATQATRDIAQLQLTAAHRGDMDTDVDLQVLTELITERSVDEIRTLAWNVPIRLKNCTVTLFRAGHILGASMIYIESEYGNVLHTGDYSNFHQFTVLPYDLPADLKVDVLITESTYAYSDLVFTEVEQQREEFAAKVEQVIERQGTVIIPAFSVGRSQEVSLVLRHLMETGRLPEFPVWLDGLAASASEVYERNGVPVYGGPVQRAARDFVYKPSQWSGVIIASSGMLLDGSMSARYAEKLLPHRRNALFFTGYLDDESPGKKLMMLHERAGGSLYLNNRPVRIEAQADSYRLSAHVDNAGILGLIEAYMPASVVLVHGYKKLGAATSLIRNLSNLSKGRLQIHESVNEIPIYFS